MSFGILISLKFCQEHETGTSILPNIFLQLFLIKSQSKSQKSIVTIKCQSLN